MAPQNVTPFLNGEVPVVGNHQPNGNAPTIEELTADANDVHVETDIKCDVLVVGAGFSGITAIHRFRKLGMSVKCLESGGNFGGVWYWNRYPGARVDSEAPFYQLNIPEVYKTWRFDQRFPDQKELTQYMAHVDKILDLRKDTYFNARVVDASWDKTKNVWTVRTQQGHDAQAKYLILASGLLHRTFTPDFPGIDEYKGEVMHSAAWKDGFNAKGKKVALIGSGATAVQITQELGKEADELTVLLRRPSYCLPMQQRKLDEAEREQSSVYIPVLLKAARDTLAGFPVNRRPERVSDVTAEEREEYLQQIWKAGGFNFALANFSDVAVNEEANSLVYQFWAKKVRERLTDPAKHQIMAPEQQPYYFGTKRCPLEHDYYDVLNRPNVRIHDLKAAPLKSFTEKGMAMADGHQYDFDVVVFATGFDSYSGSMAHMGLKSKDGVDLKDSWKEGIHTYLGLTVSGFPNMFMSYSPQAPTALSNATTLVEAQVETIVAMVEKLEKEGVTTIEAQRAGEGKWRSSIEAIFSQTLFPHTDSWWNGADVPGKTKQALVYLGGINNYEAECRATMDGWKGFEITTSA